jgi:hypothetical protein
LSLTGSQQFGLMKNVSESLAGRVAILELPPFSMAEVKGKIDASLAQVIWNGLYPEPALHPEKRDLWVRSYVATYVERDVRQLQNIRNLHLFNQFMAVCAGSHGQILNIAALSRDLGISQPAAKQWIGVLEASYICFLLRPWLANLGKRVTKSPKLYFLDPAIAGFFTRQPGPETAVAGSMGGAFMEGLVVIEAFKAFAAMGMSPALYYWRSHDGLEVDLLVEFGGRILPVEIKRTASPGMGHLQPLNRFKKLAGEKCHDMGILVCDVDAPQPMPHNNLALPWTAFGDWLSNRLP